MPREEFTGKEEELENIPVIPVSLLGQNPGIDRKIERITSNLIEGVPVSVGDLEKPATAVDLQEPGSILTDEELLKWAENTIGIDLNKECKNASESKELEKIYKKINDAYQKAKVFLVNVLKYNKDEIFRTEPTKLDSKENLLNILRKIKSVKGDNGGLGQSIRYCRLIKATMATFETTKHDAEFLEKLTSHFENSLIANEEEAPLGLVGNHKDGIEFMVQDADDFLINGVLTSRPKEFNGIVLRYVIRPESNAATALEDGIGVRIFIDKEQALRLIPILLRWFTEKMNMDVVNIENRNYFTKEQEADLKRRLSGSGDSCNFKEYSSNGVSSADNFTALILKGQLSFSEEDASVVIRDSKKNTKTYESISIHARKFEIQLVDPENENEKGENHHSVYDLKKFITARTRLDGWCPKTAFDEFINKASLESGMTSNEIRGFILGKRAENPSTQKRIAREAPIVELEIERKTIYLAFSVYERWKELGLISAEFFAKIGKARKYLDLD